MSLTTKDNGKKWIQSSIAMLCLVTAFCFVKFFTQMGDWFELESKLPYYTALSQVLSVLIAFGVFIYIIKNEKTSSFLAEVYQEAIKVIWPDKNQTVRHTVGIMIGVTVVGFILGIFDLISTYLLSLIN